MQANSLFWRLTKDEGEAAIAILKAGGRALSRLRAGAQHVGLYVAVSGDAAWTCRIATRRFGRAAQLWPRARQNSTTATRGRISRLATWHITASHRGGGSAIPALHRPQSELCRRSRLSWLGAGLDGQSDRSDSSSGAGDPHEPARSAKRNILVGLAAAHYLAGRYTKRSASAARLCSSVYGFTGGHRILYVRAWRRPASLRRRARRSHRLKELHPEISTAWIEKNVPYTPARWEIPRRHAQGRIAISP